MITALAIDDEPPALKVVSTFCRDFDFIDLQRTFTGTEEALRYLRKYPVDLLFLDIQMPSQSGIDLYKTIQQQTMVIFTTAYSEYAVEGFDLQAIDYLLKPFTRDRFAQAVHKARDYYHHLMHTGTAGEAYLFIRADYSLLKIAHADILYIEGLDDYVKIYLLGQKPVVARMTLKALTEKLPAHDFLRVHRSYIVSLKQVAQVRNKTISVGDAEIPVGSSYEPAFFDRFRAG